MSPNWYLCLFYISLIVCSVGFLCSCEDYSKKAIAYRWLWCILFIFVIVHTVVSFVVINNKIYRCDNVVDTYEITSQTDTMGYSPSKESKITFKDSDGRETTESLGDFIIKYDTDKAYVSKVKARCSIIVCYKYVLHMPKFVEQEVSDEG